MRPAWDGSPKDTAAHPGGAFILIIVRAIRMTSCSFGYFWLFLVIFGYFGNFHMGNKLTSCFLNRRRPRRRSSTRRQPKLLRRFRADATGRPTPTHAIGE